MTLPFYLSMIHYYDNSLVAKDVFLGYLGYYIGAPLGSTLVPLLISIIGYKNLAYLIGIIFFCYIQVWAYSYSIPFIMLSMFLQGMCYNMFYDSNNLFLA